jgi:integrase/recombinase XerD
MISIHHSVEDFLAHCKIEKNLSPKTLKAYRTDLAQFALFMQKLLPENSILAISKTELRDYIASLASLKPKSIKRKIASAKAMFNYMEYEDTLAINPFRKMRINIKEPKRLPSVMSLKEIAKIFKVVYDRKDDAGASEYACFENLRNIVIAELLFATGARCLKYPTFIYKPSTLKPGSFLSKVKAIRNGSSRCVIKKALLYLRRIKNGTAIKY